jgi:UDP-glucose 4-epimerase
VYDLTGKARNNQLTPIALVTGASGAIAPVLINKLLGSGYTVRALVRQSSSLPTLPASAQVAVGDITDIDSMRRAAKGVNAVFHLAAKLHINNPDPSLATEYRRVNVEGTRTILEAAQHSGVRRFVFFSTISVYGPTKARQVFDETSPLRPSSLYTKTKCEAEEFVLGNASDIAVVLRLAAVYGPRVKGNYAQLVLALQRGRFLPIGSGSNRRTLVYDEDVAAAALLVAKHPDAVGRIYNITDGRISTFNEIVTAICSALGKRPPRLHLPAAPVRVAASAVESVFSLAHKQSPVARATIDKLMEDVAVSGEKIQQELGFQPKFDLASGWRQTVRSME